MEKHLKFVYPQKSCVTKPLFVGEITSIMKIPDIDEGRVENRSNLKFVFYANVILRESFFREEKGNTFVLKTFLFDHIWITNMVIYQKHTFTIAW